MRYLLLVWEDMQQVICVPHSYYMGALFDHNQPQVLFILLEYVAVLLTHPLQGSQYFHL